MLGRKATLSCEVHCSELWFSSWTSVSSFHEGWFWKQFSVLRLVFAPLIYKELAILCGNLMLHCYFEIRGSLKTGKRDPIEALWWSMCLGRFTEIVNIVTKHTPLRLKWRMKACYFISVLKEIWPIKIKSIVSRFFKIDR